MIDHKRIPKIQDDILRRRDGAENEIIVLASSKGGPIRFLNPVGSRIFELSDGTNTIDDIIDDILHTFDQCNPTSIEEDIITFLEKLRQNNIIDYYLTNCLILSHLNS